MNEKRECILTGERRRSQLHLGNYVGSQENRHRLQDTYECFFIVAYLHTLTTRPERERISEVAQFVGKLGLDCLALGIDPERCTIFLQSGVPVAYS